MTNHYSRMVIPNNPVGSDEDFVRLVASINEAALQAVDVLKSCEMDYLVMGMSSATFWDGRKGAERYLAMMQDRAGVGVSCAVPLPPRPRSTPTGSSASRSVAVIPIANQHVRQFLEDSGFTVVRDVCLRRPSPVQIAHSTDAMCRDAIREIDGDDVEAILQVGTNLSMIRLTAAAELFLGKPVIAINTATYWHALRAAGITDRVEGFGSLLERH